MWISPIIKCVDMACNLRCSYCFYRYMDQIVKSVSIMSDDVLEKIIAELLKTNRNSCTFLWHGGEPLLAGVDFFRKAVEFQRKHNYSGIVVKNNIQTNGTLINDEFVNFFKENDFKIGISLDGPEHIHNYHRKGVNGKGSFERVMNGLELCQNSGVPVSVIAVVSDYSANFADEIYNFFISSGIKRFAFNPVFEVDRNEEFCDFSVKDSDFADFMERMADLWFKDDNPEIYIRQLSEPLKGMLSGEVSNCIFSGECSKFLDIYSNGDVRPCHSFLGESVYLGNIFKQSLSEIVANDNYLKFLQRIKQLSNDCLDCHWFSICRGGCADQRNLRINGKLYKKYVYCESRKRIFNLLERKLIELGEDVILK